MNINERSGKSRGRLLRLFYHSDFFNSRESRRVNTQTYFGWKELVLFILVIVPVQRFIGWFTTDDANFQGKVLSDACFRPPFWDTRINIAKRLSKLIWCGTIRNFPWIILLMRQIFFPIDQILYEKILQNLDLIHLIESNITADDHGKHQTPQPPNVERLSYTHQRNRRRKCKFAPGQGNFSGPESHWEPGFGLRDYVVRKTPPLE